MSKNPLLSICIPTYNRKKYLKESIENIIHQDWFNQEDIEIVISDNSSIDETPSLVRDYQKKYGNIKYFRNETNIGADRNILKVLQLWTWMYLWWVSDDDIMLPWSLALVMAHLLQNHDDDIWLFQTNFSLFNEDMRTFFQESYIWTKLTTKVYSNAHEMYRSYGYRHGWIAFFSINIFSSKIQKLSIDTIPITQFPHSCLIGLIAHHKAMFIGYNAIWFRQNNSSHDNIGSAWVFFKLFVLDHMKYMKFLRKNNSCISQTRLWFIALKMVILSLIRATKSWISSFKKIIQNRH